MIGIKHAKRCPCKGSNASLSVPRSCFVTEVANDFTFLSRLQHRTGVQGEVNTWHLQGRGEDKGWEWIGSDEIAVFIKEIQTEIVFSFRPSIVNEGDVGLTFKGDFLNF